MFAFIASELHSGVVTSSKKLFPLKLVLPPAPDSSVILQTQHFPTELLSGFIVRNGSLNSHVSLVKKYISFGLLIVPRQQER